MIEDLGDWFFRIGTPVLAVGLLLTLWALGSDWLRTRKRRFPRCPRCWYDMRGVTTLTCPECGRTAKSERACLKSRRRWRWATLGLVLVAFGGLGMWPRWRQINWLRAAPSWALLMSLDDPCVAGSFNQSPTAAQRLAGEVWRRNAEGRLSTNQLATLARKQMRSIHGPIAIHTRKAWPAGEHIYIQLEHRIGGVRPRELHIRARSADVPEIVLNDDYDITPYLGQNSRWFSSDWPPAPQTPGRMEHQLFDIGVAPSGVDHIMLDVVLKELGETLYSGEVRVPLEVPPSIDQVMHPLDDGGVDATVRSTIQSGLAIPDPRDSTFLPRPGISSNAPATVALRIAVLHGQQTLATCEAVMSFRPPASGSQSTWDSIPFESEVWRSLVGDRAAIAAADPADTSWTVRVTGDPLLALRDFESSHYWAGEIELPLSHVLKDPPAFTPEYMRFR